MRLGILAAAISLVLCLTAQAADAPAPSKKEYYHLCTDLDLVGGTWKLMVLKETPRRKEAAWHRRIRYQYLAFYPRNLYGNIATNREIMKSLDLRRIMEPQQQKGAMKYTLDNQGVLNLIMGSKVAYSYRCLAVSRDEGQYVKGDLILTGYTTKGKSKLYKLYRRWF